MTPDPPGEPPDDDGPFRPPELFPAESGLGPFMAESSARPTDAVPPSPSLVADSVISPPLQERMQRATSELIGIVVELRAAHPRGIAGAAKQVRALVAEGTPVWHTGSYLTTALTAEQIRDLVQKDADAAEEERRPKSLPSAAAGPAPRGSIHRIWPNFETGALIHRTIVTTKCQAAQHAFNALGQDIVWAVLDSGIDYNHDHFTRHSNLKLDGRLAHRTFVAHTSDADATRDPAGHGTHVAGILAGEQIVTADEKPMVAATWYHDDQGNTRVEGLELREIRGMAPRCRLLSCKVLRDDRSGDLAALLAALQYIQELNDDGRHLQVHGVNLSVGYPFDPSWFAAGLTPVCREVDRLVRSGVVVVVAAGNTGYGYATDPNGRRMRLGFDLTINDPGNAELAITVGSTSSRPHASGVSYFSSKGPTGDGRLKPDLVAPGERVVSAGSGAALEKARVEFPEATYVEDSGTSMAAPHVSGVAAAFMSVHREYIGRPEEVKRILLASATDLGRARPFQGCGLVDAMRAIQSV
ncbi:MAG: S8 family peptidase [Egibacteraceae bacterium]